ncbi:amidoligase family protein [uncultured Oscillibacter sp.]|uniref:amidoligase family protein n=1 Tax=uncultured Oscillibacter sp. TaxID=876091 RepID=UPI00261F18C6|nr:amidoligase family protein [uncultured Oscillibacter sp.]
MKEEISVRQWQKQFKAGFYDSPDIHTQCGAGWYDWFCQDRALAGRLKKIAKVVMGVTNPFILDHYYIWFKKLTYDELPHLQECMRRVTAIGAKVNDSCGLHVHVDASNHNRQSLKNLISIMYSKEDLLFKALQVNEARAIEWCQKVREPMLKQARTLSAEETSDLTQLEDIWYEGFENDGRTRHDHYNKSRYYALNLHSVFYRGTVEWRCFNSTLDPAKAAAYVHLCLAMSAQAIVQRSAVMQKTRSDNELFTFRVWLVRLGLNGDEFKETRDILLANLDGDRAWRHDKDSYEVNRRKKRHHENER